MVGGAVVTTDDFSQTDVTKHRTARTEYTARAAMRVGVHGG